eukprot:scaffold1793_cov142-Skeletonema_menzelii.AAC.2
MSNCYDVSRKRMSPLRIPTTTAVLHRVKNREGNDDDDCIQHAMRTPRNFQSRATPGLAFRDSRATDLCPLNFHVKKNYRTASFGEKPPHLMKMRPN